MTKLKAFLAAAAALTLVSSTAMVSADHIKNIVLVHGAWVDASGWKPVYEILTKQGFHVICDAVSGPPPWVTSPWRTSMRRAVSIL